MAIAAIIETLTGSGAFGFLGALANGIFGMVKDGQEHKRTLEKKRLDAEIAVQTADLRFRQTQEESAGNTFGKAIDAQTGLAPRSAWVNDTIVLWRPSLTLFLLVVASAVSLTYGGEALLGLAECLTNLSATALGFWFGTRSIEKIAVRAVKK